MWFSRTAVQGRRGEPGGDRAEVAHASGSNVWFGGVRKCLLRPVHWVHGRALGGSALPESGFRGREVSGTPTNCRESCSRAVSDGWIPDLVLALPAD